MPIPTLAYLRAKRLSTARAALHHIGRPAMADRLAAASPNQIRPTLEEIRSSLMVEFEAFLASQAALQEEDINAAGLDQEPEDVLRALDTLGALWLVAPPL